MEFQISLNVQYLILDVVIDPNDDIS